MKIVFLFFITKLLDYNLTDKKYIIFAVNTSQQNCYIDIISLLQGNIVQTLKKANTCFRRQKILIFR